jgi:tetratricopeptide (TPR) repeat protein
MSDATEFLKHGLELLKSNDLTAAESCFRSAVSRHPRLSDTHYHLGVTMMKQNRYADAEACFRNAISIQPDHIGSLIDLSSVLIWLGSFAEAETYLRHVLRLHPDKLEAQFNLAAALMQTSKLEEAEAILRKLNESYPGLQAIRYNLATTLLKMGSYADAWPLYEARSAGNEADWTGILGHQPANNVIPIPKWRGEALAGKSLLVVCEQGLGDTIQFVRFMGMLRARGLSKLTVACDKQLQRLLRSADGVDAVTISETPVGFLAYDYYCLMMSVPYHLGITLDHLPIKLPYLRPERHRIEHWKTRLKQRILPKRFRVGLVWAGNPRVNDVTSHAIDRRRSIHLSRLLPVLQVPGVAFVSLQKGASARAQLAKLPIDLQPLDLMDEVEDMADTASIIPNLDLVIAVDTAVAHLAGALGRNVWLMSRFDSCWRWLRDRNDSPWYPRVMRLFRQRQPSDWDHVVDEVTQALTAYVADKNKRSLK